jgi:hypothetical protein
MKAEETIKLEGKSEFKFKDGKIWRLTDRSWYPKYVVCVASKSIVRFNVTIQIYFGCAFGLLMNDSKIIWFEAIPIYTGLENIGLL